MKLLKRLFSGKGNRDLLHNQHLDAFCHEIVKVIYSQDRSLRYVIMKTDRGYFTYTMEAIDHLEEDEWKYLGDQDKSLPAMWETFGERDCRSLFDSLEELHKEIKSEPEYRQYFGGDSHTVP